MLQTQHQHFAGYYLPDCIGMRGQLVAYCGTYEVSAVGVEAFGYQQVNLAQIYKTKIDSDFFRVQYFGLGYVGGRLDDGIGGHALTIYHPLGWYTDVYLNIVTKVKWAHIYKKGF